MHNSFLCTITYFFTVHRTSVQRLCQPPLRSLLSSLSSSGGRFCFLYFFVINLYFSFLLGICQLALFYFPFSLVSSCLSNFVHLVCLRKKWVSCRCRSELHVCSKPANSQLAQLTIQPQDIYYKLYFFVISIMILSVEDNDKLQRRRNLPLSRDPGLAPFLALYLPKIMHLLPSTIWPPSHT